MARQDYTIKEPHTDWSFAAGDGWLALHRCGSRETGWYWEGEFNDPRGHRAWLGTGSRHQRGQAIRTGHRAAIGQRATTFTDNTAHVLRRQLYANCERAPLGWEQRGLNE